MYFIFSPFEYFTSAQRTFVYWSARVFLLFIVSIGVANTVWGKSNAGSISEETKRDRIKEKLVEYLKEDILNDSILLWSDSLSSLGGTWALQDHMDAQVFRGKYSIGRAEFARALESFYDVLQIARKNDLQDYVAEAHLQIGVVFYTQKQFEDALDNFKRSLLIYQNLKDNYRIAMLNYLVGTTLCDLNKLDSAGDYLDKAIDLKIKIDDLKGAHESKVAKARLLFLEQRYNESEKLYRECLSFFLSQNNIDAVVFTKTGLSKVLFQLHRYNEVEDVLKEALALADSLHFSERKIAVLGELKDYYIASREYEKAVSYQSQYYHLKDSIFNFDNAKTISALKSRIEADKKQAEIEALQHNEKVAGIQRIFGLAFILFLLVYLYNLYKRFSFKRKAEERLAKTNKDLENTIINLKAAEEELIHAEKMASMGRLTAGIAHELRNPLNFVANFSRLSEELVTEICEADSASDRADAARQLKNNFSLIHSYSNKADKIIRNMLQLSRKSSSERTPEQLNKLVEEFAQVAFKNFTDANPGFTCTLSFSMDQRIAAVRMNSHEITGVILSIVNNALDSMYERKRTEADYTPALKIATRLEGEKAFVTVTDNGKGIPPEIQHRIFEPFFSTKAADKGTGLGLSLCYDFIKVHHGEIFATSEKGETVLTFYLPVSSELKERQRIVNANIHF